MVQLTGFDPTKIEPSTGGADVFGTGEYTFIIVRSEMKDNKAKTGKYLEMELSCQDEGMVGRRQVLRLNVINASAQAVEIAFRELSAICHVVGVLHANPSSEELHGRPFRARLEKEGYTKSDGTTGQSSSVKAYMDLQGNPPSATGQAAGSGAPAAPAAPAAPVAPVAPPVAPVAPPAVAPPVAAPVATPAAVAPPAVAPTDGVPWA